MNRICTLLSRSCANSHVQHYVQVQWYIMHLMSH